MIYIYYGFCCLSIIMAGIAQKRNSRLIYLFSIAFVGMIVGFRGINVGIDTEAYYTYIEWIKDGIFTTSDIGFYYFSKFLLWINDSSEFVIFIYSVLTIALVFLRFWDFRDKISVSLVQFIFMAFYLQLSMNIMRQFFSIAIIFWATRFLENKKYIRYVFFNIISVSFHKTSLIGFVILFIYYCINEKMSKKKQIVMFFLLCFAPAVVVVYVNKLLVRYEMYLLNVKVDIGFMIVIKLAVLLIYIIARYKIINSKMQEVIFDKIILLIYFVGLGITALGYFYTYLDRVGLLFMMFEPVCLARMSSEGINAKIFKAFAVSLSIFLIIVNFKSNGNGVFPYTWFFKQ